MGGIAEQPLVVAPHFAFLKGRDHQPIFLQIHGFSGGIRNGLRANHQPAEPRVLIKGIQANALVIQNILHGDQRLLEHLVGHNGVQAACHLKNPAKAVAVTHNLVLVLALVLQRADIQLVKENIPLLQIRFLLPDKTQIVAHTIPGIPSDRAHDDEAGKGDPVVHVVGDDPPVHAVGHIA